MSPTHAIELHLPQYWQVFERLCRDLVRAEWGGSAELHGRSRQRQHGVDVYVETDEGWFGFQCKKRGIGKELDPETVRTEAEEARKFEPPLSRFFVLTTSSRDVKAQKVARDVTDEHRKEDPPRFSVEVLFWDNIGELLQAHPQTYIRWRRGLGIGAGPEVSTHRLPSASPEELVGREAELERLDKAWDDPRIHALLFIAVGGEGKTSLVDHWLQSMERDDWRGAEAIFVWSFYSQGAGDDRQASGDQFIDEALRFFGDPDPTEGSPRARGLRLATLVRERHSLLVLDGLEPIQHPPTHGRPGQIKDPGVSALVRELASSQPGLLVITSRQPVADLKGRTETSAPVIYLECLSTDASIHLLSRFGVKGKKEELEKVTEEVHGHALTLTLLGTFLAAAHDGDVRAWHDLPHLEQAELIGDSHASSVMAAYADWFGEGAEHQILSVLGLFDRPAEEGGVAALRKLPAIQGLTDQLVDLSAPQWNIALSRLRKARLLLDADTSNDGGLDAHPLVREYFGLVLEREHPEVYRAGHNRLYEHYAAAAPDLPDTLPEMEPLYRAIGHGCRAGRRQETYDEVYVRRVLRVAEFYSVNKLGAFGSDLTALASFFDSPWDRPAKELRPSERCWLLSFAGTCLRALGRLEEAVKPMEAGLELALEQAYPQDAVISAGNLSELTLTLGEVGQSLEHAHRSVELADQSGDEAWRMANRTTLGDARHAAGHLDEAESAFRKAEALQAERVPQYPKLYSVAGYKHCDLLLSQAAPLDGSALDRSSLGVSSKEERCICAAVSERVTQSLEWAEINQASLLTFGLGHLGLGRAKFGLFLATDKDLEEVRAELDQAVQGLRKAGQEQYVPNGLLARATLHRFNKNVPDAETDLSEALEIAKRGSMRLHECDAHLEWGRLRYSVGDLERAREHLEVARKIVEETGYGRREREVRELSEVLGVEAGP